MICSSQGASETVGPDNELDEEDEEEEDAPQQLETFVQEQEFDFSGFVVRFAAKSVCQAYAAIFAKFRTNSE